MAAVPTSVHGFSQVRRTPPVRGRLPRPALLRRAVSSIHEAACGSAPARKCL